MLHRKERSNGRSVIWSVAEVMAVAMEGKEGEPWATRVRERRTDQGLPLPSVDFTFLDNGSDDSGGGGGAAAAASSSIHRNEMSKKTRMAIAANVMTFMVALKQLELVRKVVSFI